MEPTETDNLPEEAGETDRLSGEKAQRIIGAMRESVAEVGIAGSTFGRVSEKAGVSRGLLHYYFGTKERLLVDVIRRDTDERIGGLATAMRAASSVDGLILAMFATFERTIEQETGYVYMVSELFIASRHSEELASELGSLYGRARKDLAAILREKERDGVIRLRYGAEHVLSALFASGDGAVVQRLTDPTYQASASSEVAYGVARFLLGGE